MVNNENSSDAENQQKPDLPKRLFWDWRYDAIDWQNLYLGIIARVIERGSNEEVQELIRFYGETKVSNALVKEITYLENEISYKNVQYSPPEPNNPVLLALLKNILEPESYQPDLSPEFFRKRKKKRSR